MKEFVVPQRKTQQRNFFIERALVDEGDRVSDGVEVRVRYYGYAEGLDGIRTEYNREFLFTGAMHLNIL
jgi:hypothetical protein